MPKPTPLPRAAYPFPYRITTRWADNDVYGHVNNALYYAFFDTTITAFLTTSGLIADPARGPKFFVAASECSYFRAFSFPEDVESGLAVESVGRSSVGWRIGLFGAGETAPRAQGSFVHVCVDPETGRPMEWPQAWREIFETIRLA